MAKVIKHEACPRCRANGKDRRGDNLAVYSDGGVHCFSCGYHRWPSVQVKESRRDDHHGNAHETVLPRDFTREVPGKAWQWLLQYGLTAKYWEQQGIGWTDFHSRLVFPQGDFSIGRFIGEADKRKPKWRVWGDDKQRPIVIGAEASPCVALVEDLISAHKVGQVAQAIPLFGTSVWAPLVPVLRHLGAPIVMWLDKDQEEHARKRATRLSVLTGTPVRYVFTDDDPKKLPLQTIAEVLSAN